MAAISLPASTFPVLADEPIDMTPGAGDRDGNVSAVLEQEASQTDVDSIDASVAAGDHGPRLIWVAQPIVASSGDPDDENLGVCRGWNYVAAETEEEATALRNQGQTAYTTLWASLLDREVPGAHPDVDCPGDPAEEVPAIAVRDNVRALVTGQLPRPELSVPPGRALTGMPAYLVTGGEHDLVYQETQSLEVGAFTFDVEISARGESTVDWGDGTEPVTYDQPGIAYPDGEVHHTYRDKDEVTITVTDRWVIDFTATTPSGATLTDRVSATLADEVLEGLEVREYRAVRVTDGG